MVYTATIHPPNPLNCSKKPTPKQVDKTARADRVDLVEALDFGLGFRSWGLGFWILVLGVGKPEKDSWGNQVRATSPRSSFRRTVPERATQRV